MSYIGNSPGVASQRVETAFTATSSQTVFTPSSGYTLGYCDVYQNGVKLVNGDDYTASDGVTVTLATGAATGDSIVIVASFPRGLSDGYLKSEADAKYVALTGDQTVAGVKTLSSNPILSGGTANGVPYLNGSKVLTSGSALVFDGTNFGVGAASPSTYGKFVVAVGDVFSVSTDQYGNAMLATGTTANQSHGLNLQVGNPGSLSTTKGAQINIYGNTQDSTGYAGSLKLAASSDSGLTNGLAGGIYFTTGTSTTERLRVTQDGWIGVTSPYGTSNAVPSWSTARVVGEIHASTNFAGSDGGLLRLSAGGETSSNGGQKAGIDMSGYNTTDGGPTLRFYTGGLRAVISKDGYLGVGVSNPSSQLHVAGMSNLGNTFIGSPLNTANDASSCVILHKLGQSQGYQFSGMIVANSWTGQAMVVVHILCRYTDDAVEYQVLSASTLNSNISKTTLQLVKITAGGSSYLGVRKNGGGTGTIMLNGCTQGNIPYPYEVSSFTVSSTIATLN